MAERPPAIPQRVHLVGVGGMHLSAIARILVARGHTVTGSDTTLTPLTRELAALGVTLRQGHRAEHIGVAELVVTTSAAGDDNPELVEAHKRGLPVLKRAEFIAQLMADKKSVCVAGTHGKTTTSGLIATLLVEAGRDPTYLIGGAVRNLGTAAAPGGTNAAPGEGEEIVVEADEYDRAFLEYRPDVAVVTNVEPDHLDIYGSFDELRAAFAQFMSQVKPDGTLIVCADSPALRGLVEAGGHTAAVETYALDSEADWIVEGIEPLPDGGQRFDVHHGGELHGRFEITLPIRHNVANALAGIAAGHALGLTPDEMRVGLAAYRGARRRFEFVGEAAGVTVMDDYAHHPTEVADTVAAARERFPGRRLVACFQPHTYSRTQYLLEEFRTCFSGLDDLLLVPTYAAREPESAGMDAQALAMAIESPRALFAEGFEEAADAALGLLGAGDVFFTIGAGDVDAVGPLVLDGLRDRADETHGAGRQGDALVDALSRITDVRLDEPLARHTTLGIGGPADVYVSATNADELARIVLACREHDAPVFVLGSGSNILVGDGGVRGVVIENRARALEGPLPAEDGAFRFRAESGASLAAVARNIARQGYAGLEWASGIPGTLGGAVVYNAGAYGGCLADVLHSIRFVNGTGAEKELPAAELDLVYRGSAFTRGQFKNRVVLVAEFTVWPGDEAELLERVKTLDGKRLAAQPRGRNAGSIFKNMPDRPVWKLIDEAGLRGHRIGDAQVSEKHCNFFINAGKASAADMKALIDLARDRVREQFDIELELEVALVGEGFDA